MKKRKIVIASVLKPVDDTRMFEKIGQSISDSGDVELHIFGYPSYRQPAYPNAIFHAHKPFRRLSLYRLLVPWLMLRQIIRLKPDIFIATTHELLVTGLFLNLKCKARLIYDIQENYFRNLLFTPSFPFPVGLLLAVYVRTKEIVASPFVKHFFLAESGYSSELGFIKKRFTVLENKVKRENCVAPAGVFKQSGIIQLLFSGTLAETTGVFTAIRIASELYQLDSSVRLNIIGYCAHNATLQKLRETVAQHPFITLTGGDKLVPHADIVNAIHTSDFGIIAYPPNPSTLNTIPTKLYEYLGCRLPVLLIDHSVWVKTCEPYPAAIVFNPKHIDGPHLLSAMKNRRFFLHPPGQDVFWESEAEKLLDALKNP